MILQEQNVTTLDLLDLHDRAAVCQCEASCSEMKFSTFTTFSPFSKSAGTTSHTIKIKLNKLYFCKQVLQSLLLLLKFIFCSLFKIFKC
jgi:hypothetical protein